MKTATKKLRDMYAEYLELKEQAAELNQQLAQSKKEVMHAFGRCRQLSFGDEDWLERKLVVRTVPPQPQRIDEYYMLQWHEEQPNERGR